MLTKETKDSLFNLFEVLQRVDQKGGQWRESGADIANDVSMAIVDDVVDLDFRVVC